MITINLISVITRIVLTLFFLILTIVTILGYKLGVYGSTMAKMTFSLASVSWSVTCTSWDPDVDKWLLENESQNGARLQRAQETLTQDSTSFMGAAVEISSRTELSDCSGA